MIINLILLPFYLCWNKIINVVKKYSKRSSNVSSLSLLSSLLQDLIKSWASADSISPHVVQLLPSNYFSLASFDDSPSDPLWLPCNTAALSVSPMSSLLHSPPCELSSFWWKAASSYSVGELPRSFSVSQKHRGDLWGLYIRRIKRERAARDKELSRTSTNVSSVCCLGVKRNIQRAEHFNGIKISKHGYLQETLKLSCESCLVLSNYQLSAFQTKWQKLFTHVLTMEHLKHQYDITKMSKTLNRLINLNEKKPLLL